MAKDQIEELEDEDEITEEEVKEEEHEETEEEGESEEVPEVDTPEEEEDREAIRARRREEKKRRKEKQKQLLQELDNRARSAEDLANRLAQEIEAIKSSGLSDKMQKLQSDMGEAERVYRQAKDFYDQAKANNEAIKMVEAQKAMDIAEYSYKGFKQSLENLQGQAKVQNNSNPSGLNGEAIRLRDNWLRQNAYVRSLPQSERNDVEMIDKLVYNSGYRPDTTAYWNELDRRLARAGLKKDDEKFESRTTRPKTSIVGSGTSIPAKTSNDSIAGVTKAQIQAVKQHAPEIWDDPVKRASFLKKAREQNRQGG